MSQKRIQIRDTISFGGCARHLWVYSPTVGNYTCNRCGERRDWNHPLYADAQREHEAQGPIV